MFTHQLGGKAKTEDFSIIVLCSELRKGNARRKHESNTCLTTGQTERIKKKSERAFKIETGKGQIVERSSSSALSLKLQIERERERERGSKVENASAKEKDKLCLLKWGHMHGRGRVLTEERLLKGGIIEGRRHSASSCGKERTT